MKEILEDYSINKKTAAIMPAYEIEYESIVVEENEIYHVKKHPFKLIQENCLKNGASYDGRRRSIIYLTGFSRCVPVPINPRQDIFAFPTHSPKNDKCSWLFFRHLDRIKKTKDKKQTILQLNNEKSLPIDISFHTLANQNFRIFVCRQKLLGVTLDYIG